jgi:hypothetical protein
MIKSDAQVVRRALSSNQGEVRALQYSETESGLALKQKGTSARETGRRLYER